MAGSSVKNRCNTRDTKDSGSIPGSERSPGGGNGNPLQYPCLKNPIDRGLTVQRVRVRYNWVNKQRRLNEGWLNVWKWKSLSVSDSFRPHGLYSLWNSPGQNTEVGSLPLLQEIFLTQGSNPGLLHCRRILYQLSHKECMLLLLLLSRFSRVWLCATP